MTKHLLAIAVAIFVSASSAPVFAQAPNSAKGASCPESLANHEVDGLNGTAIIFGWRLNADQSVNYPSGTSAGQARWRNTGPCAFDYENNGLIKHVHFGGGRVCFQDTFPAWKRVDPEMCANLLLDRTN